MNRKPMLDPNFETRVRESFARQAFFRTLGAELSSVRHGEVEITAPFDCRFTQQDGFLHAGTVTAMVDTACGYAAHSTMPSDSRVLSVEFKLNLLAPAVGDRFLARGSVIKSGRTLTICRGEFFSLKDGEKRLTAVMQATMMCLMER